MRHDGVRKTASEVITDHDEMNPNPASQPNPPAPFSRKAEADRFSRLS